MTYPEIIVWLATDIASSTESKDDMEANVDRYMLDLTAAVQEATEKLMVDDSDYCVYCGEPLTTGQEKFCCEHCERQDKGEDCPENCVFCEEN